MTRRRFFGRLIAAPLALAAFCRVDPTRPLLAGTSVLIPFLVRNIQISNGRCFVNDGEAEIDTHGHVILTGG